MSSSGHNSNSNLNPFPYFTQSSTPFNFPSVLSFDPSASNSNNNNNNNIFNFHQQVPHGHTPQDPISFLAPYLPISHHYSQENVINFGNVIPFPDLLTNSSSSSRTRVSGTKKDRHSKIYTAQGLRDRRVRLSIDIARKFFDLQDMLGYDKASKTLEWLFGKSKKAINELYSNSKLNSLGEENQLDQVKKDGSGTGCHDDDDDDEPKSKSSLSVVVNDEKRDSMMSKVELFHLLAKESRAKSRDQIETTSNLVAAAAAPSSSSAADESSIFKRKMMMISAKKFIGDHHHHHQDHHRVTEISQFKLLDNQNKSISKGLFLEDQPPSMIKRRSSLISGSSQRNLVISFDNIPIPINLTHNWDTSNNNNPNCHFTK